MPTPPDLETPVVVLDRSVLDRNLSRMQARMDQLGVRLRPHVKTAKSIDVLRRIRGAPQQTITVSTPKEADYFLEHGVTNILYAVGIAPGKLAHAAALTRRGTELTLILDSIEAAHSVRRSGIAFPVLIELDVDGHRSGQTTNAPPRHNTRATRLLTEMTRR